jgi:hypothetical protein
VSELSQFESRDSCDAQCRAKQSQRARAGSSRLAVCTSVLCCTDQPKCSSTVKFSHLNAFASQNNTDFPLAAWFQGAVDWRVDSTLSVQYDKTSYLLIRLLFDPLFHSLCHPHTTSAATLVECHLQYFLLALPHATAQRDTLSRKATHSHTPAE